MKLLINLLMIGLLSTFLSAKKYEKIFIQTSGHPIGNLNAMIIFMADQLDINNDSKYFSQPTIVSSFVSLDNLKESSKFGRLLAESLIHELQVRNWTVVEIKMAKTMAINKDGEFSLSRNVDEIRTKYRARSIVTGTYVVSDDTVIVNGKVLNIDSGIVLSTAQISVPLDSVSAMVFQNQFGGGDEEDEEKGGGDGAVSIK